MSGNEFAYANAGGIPQPQVMEVGASNLRTRYLMERNKLALFKMGIVEIITGLLCAVLGLVTLVIALNSSYYDFYYYKMTYSGQGIWCGIFAIVVGILGVRAKSNSSKSIYNANMVMSIIGANVMGVLTVLSGIGALKTELPVRSVLIMHLVLGFLGLLGVAIMIIHSAYCCSGVCNKSRQGDALSCQPRPTGMQQPQLIQLANGQCMLASAQTVFVPYPMAQVPVVGDTAAFQPLPQGITPPQMPANLYYPADGFQTHQIAPAPMTMDAASNQTVYPVPMQTVVTNARQTA